jgi:hypothetical protein
MTFSASSHEITAYEELTWDEAEKVIVALAKPVAPASNEAA